MRLATVRSRCECQSSLVAVLNENRHVTSGYVVARDGSREEAPAHTMGAQNPRFDVGWLCPVCGRNVLRSFAADALAWREAPEVPAGAAASAAAGADAIAPAAASAAAGAPAVGGAPAAGSGPGVGHQAGASAVKLGSRGAPPGTRRASVSRGTPGTLRASVLRGAPGALRASAGRLPAVPRGHDEGVVTSGLGWYAANVVRARAVAFGRAFAFGG